MTKEIIVGRNEVVAKVMFLLVSVILLTGGLPKCMLGYQPPGSRHPPGKQTPHGIRSMSGCHASYWNAFLFVNAFYIVS